MVRIAPEDNEAALAEEHVREFEMSGKKMSGWLIVAREGVETDEDLAGWVDAGADHAASHACQVISGLCLIMEVM